MNLKKKIFYWSPFLVRIATPRAVINSAYSLIKFSEDYDCSIINFFGEFDKYQNDIKQKKIKLINYSKFRISKILPSEGKIQSRFSFLVMFCLGFFPLKKLISERKPDYIVIHLITSLPLILLMFFYFNDVLKSKIESEIIYLIDDITSELDQESLEIVLQEALALNSQLLITAIEGKNTENFGPFLDNFRQLNLSK